MDSVTDTRWLSGLPSRLVLMMPAVMPILLRAITTARNSMRFSIITLATLVPAFAHEEDDTAAKRLDARESRDRMPSPLVGIVEKKVPAGETPRFRMEKTDFGDFGWTRDTSVL